MNKIAATCVMCVIGRVGSVEKRTFGVCVCVCKLQVCGGEVNSGWNNAMQAVCAGFVIDRWAPGILNKMYNYGFVHFE